MNASIAPNRDLLHPKFESYKLSLKSALTFSASEIESIDLRFLPPNAFSKLEIQLSSLHNCLFQDRFCPSHLFYITSSGKVKCVIIPQSKEHFQSGRTVFVIPAQVSTKRVSACNVSLKFLQDYVLLADGFRGLYLMESSERLSDIFPCWEVVFEKQLDLASESGYLIDAVQTKTAAGEPQVDCILLSVIKSNGEKSCVHIDWFTIACSSSEWRVSRLRRLACSVFPDYVAFEGGPFTLAVRSTQPLVPLFDSAKPAINSLTPSSSPVEVVASDLGSTVSRFTWTQSLPSMPQGDSCLLNVLVKLSDNQQLANPKTAIDVVCRPCETSADGANMKFHRLELRVQTDKGSVQLCNARLFAPIRPSNTMWTYDRETNCIDITLVKEEAGTWPRLFAEPDEEMRLGVRYDDESLPAVTTNAPDEPMQSCFNVEQLEDVDMVQEADDEEAVMQRIDGESLKTVLKAEMIGHQKLYVALTSPVESSVNQPSQLLCTRYDVDGLVWAPQPDNQEHPWVHVATLQAFGYVLASKQNRRFVASPPLDVSQFSHVPFVAVTDMSRHVYIYWQPNPTKDSLTELRHRQLNNEELGSGVVHTSWQQVVSLPDAEEVIGFAAVATNPYSACVVATRKNLHLICLDEEDQ